MKIEALWSVQAGTQPVHGLVISPDGTKIYASTGQTVVTMTPESEIVRQMQTPHTLITGLAISPDGQTIVTMGTDGAVMFHNCSGAALFKYSHQNEVQAAAFSPDGSIFVSAAIGDIGVYHCKDVKTKVMKQSFKGTPRAIAWAPGSDWFVISTQDGDLIMMTPAGLELNACNIGAPAWALKIVPCSSFLVQQDDRLDIDVTKSSDDEFVIPQTVTPSASARSDSGRKHKTDEAREEFVETHGLESLRVLVGSWDMRYRVLDPSIYMNGALITKSRKHHTGRSRSPGRNKLDSFLISVTELPFIPLCMEIIGNYAFLSGVGGSLIVLNSSNGKVLLSLYQVWESDPFISKAPRSVMDRYTKSSGHKKTVIGQVTTYTDINQKLLEIRKYEALANRNVKNVTNPLAFHGMHTIWCYSMAHLDPSFLVLGLSNGVVLCLVLEYAMVHSLYNSLYAYRRGLMSVSVVDLATGSESMIEVGMHVEKVAIYESTLAIKTAHRLLLYRLQDPVLKKRNIDTSMDYYGAPAADLLDTEVSKWQHTSSLTYAFETAIKKRFLCSQLLVASNHFFLCNTSQIVTYDFSGKQTDKWVFKQSKCTYVKPIGGLANGEAVLAGFESGQVCIFRIGNRFPVELLFHRAPVVSLDMSPDRRYISIIDKDDTVSVYAFFDDSKILMPDQGLLYVQTDSDKAQSNYLKMSTIAHISIDGHHSVAAAHDYSVPLYTFKETTSATWDLVLPGILARSMPKSVDICIENGTSYTFQLSTSGSFVLCQSGNKAFIFNVSYLGQSHVNLSFSSLVELVEIPMMPMVIYRTHRIMHKLIDASSNLGGVLASATIKSELNEAIRAANLGVPISCWRDLAVVALFSNELDLACEILATIGDIRILKVIAEITHQNGPKTYLLLCALALSICDHFSEASLLFAASGDIEMATELLFFIGQDCAPYKNPNSSLISTIAQKLICNELHSDITGSADNILEILKLQEGSVYSPLGVQPAANSRDIHSKFLLDIAERSGTGGKSGISKFMSALDVAPNKGKGTDSSKQYNYFSDYRILLRRQIAKFAKSEAEKTNLIIKHSKFLERSLEWKAAAASYLDVDDPESAIGVLIASSQTGTLLKLLRTFPPITRETTQKVTSFDDFNTPTEVEEYAPSSAMSQVLKRAYRRALIYFEKSNDYSSAIFIAQRLGDPLVLLRLLIHQGSWSQVESLGKAYPEMLPSIHEAKASMLLKEGRFIEALERLRLSGNTSKEVIIIKQLIDASINERKFNLTRALMGQLAKQIAKSRAFSAISTSSLEYYTALKAIRARVLVYTGYQQISNYINDTFHSFDVSDITMIKFHDNTQSSTIVTTGIFLTGYAAMPSELMNADYVFSSELEGDGDMLSRNSSGVKGKGRDKQGKNAALVTTSGFVTSSTTPQLGSLSYVNLGLNNANLPPGLTELVIWVCLALAAKGVHPDIEARSLRRILSSRLPSPTIGYFRRQMLLVKGSSSQAFRRTDKKGEHMQDRCPRCMAQVKALPQPRPFTTQDLMMLANLPHCCPVYSDICKTCGIPIVRSALTLQILPLVLVEPDDETGITVAIEKASDVEIDIEALMGETNRLTTEADDLQTDEGVVEVLRKAAIAGDGRGAILTKTQLEQISPINMFVVDDLWSSPTILSRFLVGNVIKRIFVRTVSDFQLHYCAGCGFFFEGVMYEEYIIVTGCCPICGSTNVTL